MPQTPCRLLKEAKEKNECLIGSWGAEVIDELKPWKNEIIVINFGSDSFERTDFDLILKNNRIRTLYFTEQCIEHVVGTTMKRAMNMGHSATLQKDCTSGFADQNYHPLVNSLPLSGELSTAEEFVTTVR